jgi:hypothetical protein
VNNFTERSPGNIAQRKPVIYKKCIALAIVVILVFISLLVVRHFFYILDSYYYTAEFHVMFMKHNLRTGNVELFADYFKSLKNITSVFPMLLGSYLVQDYWLPFSRPILVSAVISAFGIKEGMALGYLSFILVGLISFGIGIFFLGDILFIFKQKMLWGNMTASVKYVTGGIAGILFAFPLIPIVLPATLGALVRMPLKRIIAIMFAAFVIRLGLLVSAPGVFA